MNLYFLLSVSENQYFVSQVVVGYQKYFPSSTSTMGIACLMYEMDKHNKRPWIEGFLDLLSKGVVGKTELAELGFTSLIFVVSNDRVHIVFVHWMFPCGNKLIISLWNKLYKHIPRTEIALTTSTCPIITEQVFPGFRKFTLGVLD